MIRLFVQRHACLVFFVILYTNFKIDYLFPVASTIFIRQQHQQQNQKYFSSFYSISFIFAYKYHSKLTIFVMMRRVVDASAKQDVQHFFSLLIFRFKYLLVFFLSFAFFMILYLPRSLRKKFV